MRFVPSSLSNTSCAASRNTSAVWKPTRNGSGGKRKLLLTVALFVVGCWIRGVEGFTVFTPITESRTRRTNTATSPLHQPWSSSSSFSPNHQQQHGRAPATHLFATGDRGGGSVKTRNKKRVLKPRLGLLTFDLDDTLFPTQAVVQHANLRMIQYLAEQGYPTTLEDYQATARAIRQQFRQKDDDISYTDLRKRAIEMELKRISGNPYHDFTDLVDKVYTTWEHERHAAAEYYLSPVVVEALHNIRRHFGETSLCIAAITNGKGNPLHMPSLRQFFDFCVSGEDDDVFPHRKPHSRIYEIALERYRKQYLSPSDDAETKGDQEETFLWCHVGDCLAHDVGASADCGAFAVWFCPHPEVVQASLLAAAAAATNPTSAADKSTSVGNNNNNNNNNSSRDNNNTIKRIAAAAPFVPPQPSWSTATQDDIAQRNELANEAFQGKVGAHIYHMSQLLDVLKKVARPDRQASLQRRRRL